MSTAAASVVVFVMAAALSFVVQPRFRWLLVVGVLLVPIVLGAPAFIRTERDQAALKSAGFSPPPPFYWPQLNPALLRAIVADVPEHASVAMVNGDLDTGYARWLAYEIAPRQLTTKPENWTIVIGETPGHAGLNPTHEAQYGNDWLIAR